ncbi:cell division ATPase MinD [Candidatus Woesearchaeota archaeon]|nr:cell division ATPase MinD [Candidatus Woesearchaeota archaeon]
MTKFIVVASAKGGVGKTTTAINLGTALLSFGRDVILVDGNLSTPNVGVYLGAPHTETNIHQVIGGEKSIRDSIYLHSHGLKIVPGSVSVHYMDKTRTDQNKLADAILNLAGTSEIVIIDSAAGTSKEAVAAIKAAEEIIIVTTPELAAVTDAYKTVKLAKKYNKKILGVVVTRVRDDGLDMAKEDIEALLEAPVIALIPEDDNVRLSHKMRNPVTYTHPDSSASVGYKKLAAKLLGENYVESIEKQDTMFDYVMKRLGLK